MLFAFLEKMLDACFAVIPRHKPSFAREASVHLIAHRGAHDHRQDIIENTLAAFRLAEKTGCWGIELDVHATADQVLVVHHDPTLNRLWGHDAAIANLSFAQLRYLLPEIPSLAEVVSEFGQRMHLFIELKAPFYDEDALVQVLQGLNAGVDYHLLSLTPAIFQSLSQFPNSCLLLVASAHNTHQLCDLSLRENYGGVLGHYLLFSNKLVHQLKKAGQLTGVGFVDSRYSLYRELNREINYVFTNRAQKVSHDFNSLLKVRCSD